MRELVSEFVVATGTEAVGHDRGLNPGLPHQIGDARLIAPAFETYKMLPRLLHEIPDAMVAVIPPEEIRFDHWHAVGNRLLGEEHILIDNVGRLRPRGGEYRAEFVE